MAGDRGDDGNLGGGKWRCELGIRQRGRRDGGIRSVVGRRFGDEVEGGADRALEGNGGGCEG